MGISAGIAAVGVGVSIFGQSKQASAAKDQAAANRAIIEQERRQEELRRRAMELDARRRSLEAIRKAQRARASALTVATNQGAGLGSGLQGAFGQISGQTGVNILGVDQGLELGRENFGINAEISNQRMNLSNAATSMATGQGITSLGGSILSSAQTLGRLSSIGGFGGSSSAFGGSSAYNPAKIGSLY